MAVVHLNTLIRGVHLAPDFGDRDLPASFDYRDSLDAFKAYYVNKYADGHLFELLSRIQDVYSRYS